MWPNGERAASASSSPGSTRTIRPRAARAEDAYRAGLRLRPRHTAAANNLALLVLGQGDIAAARAELARALRLDADYDVAWLNAARLLDAARPSPSFAEDVGRLARRRRARHRRAGRGPAAARLARAAAGVRDPIGARGALRQRPPREEPARHQSARARARRARRASGDRRSSSGSASSSATSARSTTSGPRTCARCRPRGRASRSCRSTRSSPRSWSPASRGGAAGAALQ